MEPPCDEGTKSYSNGPGHTTKMAVIPMYGKNLSVLWNRNADDLETWYTALSTTKVVQMMPLIILITLFQEANIFGTDASLTYGPQIQIHTCV